VPDDEPFAFGLGGGEIVQRLFRVGFDARYE
jgi:hypothetical protein